MLKWTSPSSLRWASQIKLEYASTSFTSLNLLLVTNVRDVKSSVEEHVLLEWNNLSMSPVSHQKHDFSGDKSRTLFMVLSIVNPSYSTFKQPPSQFQMPQHVL